MFFSMFTLRRARLACSLLLSFVVALCGSLNSSRAARAQVSAVQNSVNAVLESSRLKASASPARAERGARGRVKGALAGLPLQFEPNEGQAAAGVDFVARGRGYALMLAPGEALFALRGRASKTAANVASGASSVKGAGVASMLGAGAVSGAASAAGAPTVRLLRMKLAGANAGARGVGEETLPGSINYLRGGASEAGAAEGSSGRQVSVRPFGRVRYAEIYRGVDVVYYGRQGELEYDFVVSPGAEAAAVAFQFEGAEKLSLSAEGDLLVAAGGERVRLRKPFAYQEMGGQRREVAARYVRRGARTYGFELGGYDASRPLVIDPVLSYSTYLGGSGSDFGNGVAVDASGNIYVAGHTYSDNFPTTVGAYQTTLKPSPGSQFVESDIFVTKLDAAGALVYSTYIGGAKSDFALGLAIDAAGNAYVSGSSSSTDFPVVNAAQSALAGSDDAVVLKLSAAGNQLLYSTYLGGTSSDGLKGIIVDSSGNAYAAGHTYSANFPVTAGAFQTAYAGGDPGGDGDAFIVKLNPSASGAASLLYSTYFGGSGGEFAGFGLALDAAGNLYFDGRTTSGNLPVTSDAVQTVRPGGNDGFVSKMKLAGTGAADLLYSSYLGGGGEDRAIGLALDPAGSVYLTGYTTSSNFPLTKQALQTAPAGREDIFVTKLNLSKQGEQALVYSTLVGGSDNDRGWSIAVDTVGNAYLTGETRSADMPITAGAFQSTIGGVSDAFSAPGGDAFAAKLNVAGTALVYFTYLGGSGGDAAYRLALDASNNAYISGGYTFSNNFPTTSNALQSNAPSTNGTAESFVARIDNPSSFAQKPAASDEVKPLALAALPNPIDDPQKFVRQQYRDFLNREPDAAGLSFWTNQITECGSQECREVRRINVSAAFFLSIEFQQTGYLVYRLYRTSFARLPRLQEFSPDARAISDGVAVRAPGWEAKLEANTRDFLDAWVARPAFKALYDTKSNAQYVDALYANAGVVPTVEERNALVNGLNASTETRATVLRKIAEHETLKRNEFNRAFVLMQYFGYLQRNFDDPPDKDSAGLDFWLGKLNEFGGDYVRAEMVKGFITSPEYRRRFGQD